MKFFLSLAVACYCFYYLYTIEAWHFIDNVDLVIHEAGHVVFSIFGNFMYIAGGSLGQLIMPGLFLWYFWSAHQRASASIMTYWLAVNFFSVAHYASDAVNMRLELLGGDTSGHDWHNLLSMTHLLGRTTTIANFIYLLGILSIILGIFWAYQALLEDGDKVS
jgi:hypothetical protein